MHRSIYLLGLVAIWLDMVAAAWWPLWLIPIWLWVGIVIAVYHKNTSARWLWLLSFSAWSLFVASPLTVLAQLVIFFLGGEAMNFIYNRYLPVSHIILSAVVSLVALSINQLLFMAVTGQAISWPLVGRVIVTTIILIVYGIFYVARQKVSKKQYL